MTAKRVKTSDGQRLAWWGATANEAYWYDHFVEDIDRTHNAARTQHESGFLPILSRHLPKEGCILEAGCGTGWVVAYLKQRGYSIEGVDYSASLVRQVLERYPDLPIRTGDVCNLDIPNGYYQGYISLGVIEHRREGPEPFLREAYRIVAPGGTLCISIPYFNRLRQLKAKLGTYNTTIDGLEFYQYGFTTDYFRGVLERHGFNVKRFEFYGTNRCFQEEVWNLYKYLSSQRVLWRLPRLLDRLDSFDIAPHMIMAIAARP